MKEHLADIRALYKQSEKIAHRIKNELVQLLEKCPNRMILTDGKEFDKIYTYRYDLSTGFLNEYQVKAIRLDDCDELVVCFDDDIISYNEEQALEYGDWYGLFDGEIFGYFTAYNIAEYIHEYVKLEE